jgi:Ni2+-binding GTPase involved in maturation of urease and hydrogenase
LSAHVDRQRPSIVAVGGFLGSGKTSLILAAARRLQKRGLRCAVVLNDQGKELVDTRHVEQLSLHAAEVTGGCFCCRLSALESVIEEMQAWSPDVIFAEPVGSCTDISATVLAPLREDFARYRVAPFTVLVDPARAAALLRGDADADLAFLFQKQLQEADLVCITKTDLYSGATTIPGVDPRQLSAKSGQGIQEWLDEVLFGHIEPGMTIFDIDYARYARAEAALTWLNLSFNFEPLVPVSPAFLIGPFLDGLDKAMTSAGVSLVHMKVFDGSPTGWLKAAMCNNGEEPIVEGDLDASPASRHELLLNLRAKGSPIEVQRIVEALVEQLRGRIFDIRLDCFSPAAPQPQRRVAHR